MTPDELLACHDAGRLWPDDASAAGFPDLDCAYRAALAVRALRVARGEQPRGFKVGFTNRAIWPIYQVFAPIWGTVWDTTLALCDGAGRLSLDRLCQPRIEPEAVFGFKATPPPDADASALFDVLDWVAPGFEIVQSHRPGWKFTAPETVADAGLHGRLLVGPAVPIATIARDAATLGAVLARTTLGLHRDGALVEEGIGANVLDSPLQALLHFVGELRRCPGAPELGAGDVVTTGTWTDAWPVRPGQTWTARFGAPLSELTVRFG